MFNPNAAPVKVYGPAVLTLPMSFFVATNQGQQVQALTQHFSGDQPRLQRVLAKLFGC